MEFCYLVAHSMGGLAVRFALDEAYSQIADLSDEVGGVVTLDTPFQGSMWGNTLPSSAWSALKKDTGFPAEGPRPGIASLAVPKGVSPATVLLHRRWIPRSRSRRSPVKSP